MIGTLYKINSLENLYTYRYLDAKDGTSFTVLNFERVGNICKVHADLGSSHAINLKANDLFFKFPVGFVPKELKIVLLSGTGQTFNAVRLKFINDSLYVHDTYGSLGSLYLNLVYFC